MNAQILQGAAERETEINPQTPAPKSEAAQRAIAHTNRQIIAEWEARGLKPLFANGQPVSLSLAKMTGLLQKQIERGFSPSTAGDLDEAANG